MSKPGLCCDSCFVKIAKRSSSAAKLWLDLCEYLEYSSSLYFLSHDEMHVLEILGFIVTTETLEETLVKVLGRKVDAMGVYFCGGKCSDE